MSWFVKPEPVRLDLSDGQFVVVKKYLTAGDTRRMYVRMWRQAPDGGVDPLMVGVSKILAYLVDWSLTDLEGRPVDLRESSDEQKASYLDNLDADRFGEILAAIEEHETATAEEKKLRIGSTPSAVTSQSPAAMVGAMSGSPN